MGSFDDPRSAAPWVFGGLLVVLLAYGALMSRSSGSPAAPPTSPAATSVPTEQVARVPTPPEPARLDLGALVDGNATLTDGPFTLEADEAELSNVIKDGLDASGTPVEELDIALVDQRDGGLMTFDAVMSDGGVPLSGEIALEVVDGRLEPEVTEARMAGVLLPGFARGVVDDVVEQAADLGDHLAAQGVVIRNLETTDGRLSIEGEKS